jgi:hypothetical protein
VLRDQSTWSQLSTTQVGWALPGVEGSLLGVVLKGVEQEKRWEGVERVRSA